MELKYINVLKGIGIILVVFGHTGINEDIRKYIYSFHMPLFLIISGYLYNGSFDLDKIKNKFKKLIGSYFFFVILSFIVPMIFLIFKKPIDNFNYDLIHIFYLKMRLIWNTPLWFLVSLFFLELIYSILDKTIFSSKKIGGGVLFILLNLFFYKNKIFLPFGISISLSSLILFHFGKILRKYFDEIYLKVNNIHILLLGSLGLVVGLYNTRVDLYRLEFSNNIFLYYIAIILNVCFYLFFSKRLENLKGIKIVEYLGKNSLIILGTHYIVIWFYHVFANFACGLLNIEFSLTEYYGLTAVVVLIVEYILILIYRYIEKKYNKKF